MTKQQLTTDYNQAKARILSNSKLTQVEKDIALYRKWRLYVSEHSNIGASSQEAASISLTIKK